MSLSDTDLGQVGIGEVALIGVVMVDETNGYVLCLQGPWEVWRPGFWSFETYTQHKTITRTEFDALPHTKAMRITDATPLGSYDAQRKIWTYPAEDS